MTRKNIASVFPLHKDKFYVYALFKPNNANPFYIGKGKGDRINQHFRPGNLKINNKKTAAIKKYGDKIRREILCYFDSEKSAYEFEEYLISLYGLEEEGGCLYNYAKTRFQYSDRFVKEISSTGHLTRKRKHSPEKITEALKLFYIHKLTFQEIELKTSIPSDYLYYVLSGVKCKKEYSKFITNNPQFKGAYECTGKEIKQQSVRSIAYTTLHSHLLDVLNGELSLKDSSKVLGLSMRYLDRLFTGKIPNFFCDEIQIYKDRKKSEACGLEVRMTCYVEERLMRGEEPKAIAKTLNISKNTVYRIRNKWLERNNPGYLTSRPERVEVTPELFTSISTRLLAGESADALKDEYGIGRTTIYRIRRKVMATEVSGNDTSSSNLENSA